jgi:hypothetical protein
MAIKITDMAAVPGKSVPVPDILMLIFKSFKDGWSQINVWISTIRDVKIML